MLTQEDHDWFKEKLGFNKVMSRCPICYIEEFINKKVNKAIEKQEKVLDKRLDILRKELNR